MLTMVRLIAILRFGDRAYSNNKIDLQQHIAKETKRSRAIVIPSGDRPKADQFETISFHLFDNITVYGHIDKIYNHDNSGGTWSGVVSTSANKIGSSSDRFTLSCYADSCAADISMGTSQIRIQPHGVINDEPVHSLLEIEHKSKAKSGFLDNPWLEKCVPPTIREKTFSAEAVVDQDLIIDIGVMYTVEALTAFGGR